MVATAYDNAMKSIGRVFLETNKPAGKVFNELLEDSKQGAEQYGVTEDQYIELVHIVQDGMWLFMELGLMKNKKSKPVELVV